MNSPAFQFYPQKWLGDDKVLLMSWTARAMHLQFMCIAWQQEPACTLPDDDELLQAWLNHPSEWEILKRQIFRAWKLENGRWVQYGLLKEYEKQRTYSENKRLAAEARWKREGDARAMQDQESCMPSAYADRCSLSLSSSLNTDKEECISNPSVAPLSGDEAKESAQPKQVKPKRQTPLSTEQKVWFYEWYEGHYPRKEGKRAAELAFARLVRTEGQYEKVLSALKQQLPGLKARERQYIPHPATWLNQGRWEDEIETEEKNLCMTNGAVGAVTPVAHGPVAHLK